MYNFYSMSHDCLRALFKIRHSSLLHFAYFLFNHYHLTYMLLCGYVISFFFICLCTCHSIHNVTVSYLAPRVNAVLSTSLFFVPPYIMYYVLYSLVSITFCVRS